MSERLAITGVGAVTPLGVGSGTLFERWVNGECGLRDGGGVCDSFDPSDHLSRKEIRRSDRFTQLALAAAEEALVQAGWSGGPPVERERVGSVIATSIGGIHSIEEELEVLGAQGPDRVSPLGVPRLMANAASAAIAMRYDLRGESCAVVSACSSGAQSIGAGARMVLSGELDAVVVGGADAAPSTLTAAAYSLMGATSDEGVSRPFDRRRDGFVPSEGAAMMVLESSEVAGRRGAAILGWLLGYGASSDAHHLTAPHPEGRGAAQAMRMAMTRGSIEPEDVDYVNAHGTSTQLNDRIETAVIKEVLGERAWKVPVSSAKSSIGHLQGAAGSAEAVVTLLALRNRKAPPTLGLEQPDESLDLDYVPGKATSLEASDGKHGLIGLSNSFGFGGHNATVALASEG